MTRSLLFALCVLLAACSSNRTFPDRDAFVPADAGTLSCVPNLDGRIDARELAPALGITQNLLVNPAGTERTVNLVGLDVEGRRVWPFGDDFADDQVARIEASELRGRWFADSFPAGEFVAPLDLVGGTLGVYSHDDDALRLHGVASAEPGADMTLLVYDTPIQVYRFPLAPGDEHIAVGEITNGTVLGLAYAGRDIYEVRVTSSGRLELPDLTFDQAMRVDVRITNEPAVGAAMSRRQTSFLFECFGEVARATSRPGEMNPDFTVAAELRRLSL